MDGVDEDKRATLRRFAAVGAASPLAALRGDDDSEARDAIAGYLAATPGAHFSKVRDDLGLGTGETQHHLRRLVRDDAVESRKDGEYRRYFPADRFSGFEQVALGYLRRETPRLLLVALLRNPEASQSTLAERTGVSRATVSKRLGDLEAAGLVDEGAVTRPETVLMLVAQYADSFGETAAALAAEADEFVSFSP
jgi:predicted transcriptional regulator